MTTQPATSPVPLPIFLAQSSKTSTPAPAPTLMPRASNEPPNPDPKVSSSQEHVFPLPKLRLEIRDLSHAGCQTFLTSVIASDALSTSVQSVLALLYKSPSSPTTTVPSTRSVTLILRPMGGVAYTTGNDLDSDHKEIHFSLEYIHSIPQTRKVEEIMGVLTHEMVHCYQYNAFGTCPGGLVEGIADWVRLQSNLSPPHWKKEASGKWDAGYQHTGYFLDYLEKRFGTGLIRRMNEKLRIERYEEKKFWTELCGRPVEQLWADYGQVVEAEDTKRDEDECVLVEKEDAATPKNGQFENGSGLSATAEVSAGVV